MLRTRFAPSPNGSLHLGHAWSAIVAHDLAKAAGGEFLLRIEDIDGDRSREDMVLECQEDLRWLGLEWHGAAQRQSARLLSYSQAAGRLKHMGLLYPCQCSRAQVAAQSTVRGPDGPVYAGTCLGRDVEPEGAPWRLDVASAMKVAGPLVWHDALAGQQKAQPDLFGDVVLLRRDAPASYHLAATVDDAAQGVTLVTRGADLFAASHVHRLLQALLDLPVPRWHHHDLLVDESGNKLAKRRGSPSLADRRRSGEDGLALAAALRAEQFPSGISLALGLERKP